MDIADHGWHRPADGGLAGKQIAIATPGGPIDFSTRWVLKKWKLEPMRDVNLIHVGPRKHVIRGRPCGSVVQWSRLTP